MSNDLRVVFKLSYPGFEMEMDLTLPGQGVTALFGHSGSGKTTCLRVIAGLEQVENAEIRLGQLVWQSGQHRVPVHQRALGYVFQEASLFPHLSVLQNIQYGQKRSLISAEEKIGPKAILHADVLALLGIEHLLARMPAQLSGGERQRVAIARALLSNPRILLMDEPLAALDLKRKQEILPYLERLHRALSIPVIYVSHAPDEVARLADHIVLLEQGKVLASGPLNAVLGRADLPQAFADDAGVVLQTAIAVHEEDDLTRLDFGEGCLYVGRRSEAVGHLMRCRIHARDVSLALDKPETSSILNVFPVQISAMVATETLGHVLVELKLGQTQLLARITERSCRLLKLEIGQVVWALVKAVAVLD